MNKVFGRNEALTDTPFHYCPGCSHGIIHRLISEVLWEMNILEETIGVAPVGCATFAMDYFNCDFIGAAHGRAQAVATGVKRALPDKIVFTYQGDGDIASIGTQHAIHTAARGEKITTIMVNNAIYAMTGGQMAPTTLVGQKSTTSPYGRSAEEAGFPLDLPPMLKGLKGTVYIASGSVDSPKNIMQTKKMIRKAFEVQKRGLGFSLVSILGTCPVNWNLSPEKSLSWLQKNMLPYFEMGELKVTKEVAEI